MIIIVSKESGNKIKITPKSGEAYSHFKPKIIAVESLSSNNVVSATGDLNGQLTYNNSTKTLGVTTEETSAGDIAFSFTGTKQ